MVILYNPPSSAGRKPVLPLSLLALGAVLEGRRRYRILDGNLEPQPLEALRSAIRETDARVLATTVMPGPQLGDAVVTCRRLRAEFPALKIVWGGYFPSQHPEVCLRSGFVDYVVRGHGEVVFSQLIGPLLEGEAPGALPGVRSSDDLSAVGAGPMSEMPDPEQLPDFPYHRLPMSRYARPTFLGERTLSHHSSYGCPFVCNFCAVVNLAQGRWLAQSGQRVAQVVRRLHDDYGADAIEFQDNNFFVQESRIAEFAGRVRPLNLGWWGEARIDTLLKYSDSTWRQMRDSGLRMVFMGAESASDQALTRMEKGGTASCDKTLQMAEQSARFDIVPEFSFMVGSPPDPEADVERTLRFIRHIKSINSRSEIILYLYTPVPLSGSLYEAAQSEGFVFPETLDEWVTEEWLDFSQRRGRRLPWISRRIWGRLSNFERVLNARFPTSTDTRLTPFRRGLLRALSGWRYRLQLYHFPLELRLLQRLYRYQRPETAGF